MNPESLEQRLREAAWRRPLTVAEQAALAEWLAQHPDARAEWAAEAALSAALRQLPERRPPSNLTARVLAEIDREALATARARRTNWFGWLGAVGWRPRIAVVVLALGAFVLVHHERQQIAQARAVHALAEATLALPSPEVLQDMDVIRRINLTPAADMELLALDLK
jgi:anti-sigma factor RsiW